MVRRDRLVALWIAWWTLTAVGAETEEWRFIVAAAGAAVYYLYILIFGESHGDRTK